MEKLICSICKHQLYEHIFGVNVKRFGSSRGLWIAQVGINRKISGNITIIYLPPYSPAVERLWQYIKYNILRNKIYDTISLLEDVLCKFISSLSRTIVKQVCYAS
ncbi:hypothetical protein Wcon_01041 [Wolbachia endosymbiont of Cylisticus convexus]|nr:hypothetical protein Wcon_01041 [Wolbachia endosymbiont of Cylisticus convexus]